MGKIEARALAMKLPEYKSRAGGIAGSNTFNA
jgi:hypothetical protein